MTLNRDMLSGKDRAVSNIIGTVLLMGVTLTLFAGVTIWVMGMADTSPDAPHVNLVGYMQDETVFLEHRGGDTLMVNDTEVRVWKGNQRPETIIETYTLHGGDTRWAIGDYATVSVPNASGWQVSAVVVDTASNSIVMSGVVQEGYMMPPSPSEPPQIVDHSADEATTGDPYLFDIEIQGQATHVYVDYWYDGDASQNISLQQRNGRWQREVTVAHTLTPLWYTVSAGNAGGWTTTSPREVPVRDNDSPVIDDRTSSEPVVERPFTFTARVTDNIAVDVVSVEWWMQGDEPTVTQMTLEDGTASTASATVTLGKGEYLCYQMTAVDTSGNEAMTDVVNLSVNQGRVHRVPERGDDEWYTEIYEATNVAEEGDTIYVYAGKYKATGEGKHKVEIAVDGISLEGHGDVVFTANQEAITINANNVRVSNLSIRDIASGQPLDAGVHILGGSNITIRNMDIAEARNAVRVAGGSDISIENCSLHNNTKGGVYASDASTVAVAGCTIVDNSMWGVRFTSVNDGTIADNVIHDNGMSSNYGNVRLEQGTIYVNVSGNQISNSFYGISMDTVSWNTVYENTLSGHIEAGVYLTSSDENMVTGNDIYSNRFGVHLYQGNYQNTVIGNDIHGHLQTDSIGIYIQRAETGPNKCSEDNDMTNNSFWDNTEDWRDECSGNTW